MQLLYTALQKTSVEESHQIFLFWIIDALIAFSFTVESIIEIFILPANAARWLTVILVIDSAALITFYLARAGHLRQAGWIFIAVLWALFTGLAITENGVRAPTVDIAYLLIILVAGLILGERIGILVGGICSLTLLGLSLAGLQGLLPTSQVERTIWSTWEADVFYLAIVIVLQYLTVHSIKEALAQARNELIERRRVEASLRKSEEERVRIQMHVELHRLLEKHIEQEHLKIARDLHDGPVQDLIGATFSLQGLIEDAPDERYRQSLQAVQQVLQEQVGTMRTFAGELRSPTLTKFGLVQAIREHAEKFKAKHPEIDVQVEAPVSLPTLDEPIRLALFRIYQEVMNNIFKHAQATQVIIRASVEKQCVLLEIQDNGVGFSLPDEWIDLARRGHLGLVGMRERAESIGGHMDIVSQKNNGTTVQVLLPLSCNQETTA